MTDQLSKALTYILRHGAQKHGLTVRPDGYVDLLDVMNVPVIKGHRPTMETIKQVVQNCPKQRFSLKFSDGRWTIRANQGHTIQGVTNEALEALVCPDDYPIVIHGTYMKFWDSIRRNGLSKMARKHIHMATGMPCENKVKSGMRGSCDLIIYINLRKAMADGIQFWVSQNGVILTEGRSGLLSPDYFLKVVRRYDQAQIFP